MKHFIILLSNILCYKLNTVGTMSSLERTKQGKFKIENSYTLNDVEKNNYKSLQLEEIFDYKRIDLTEEEYEKVKNGNSLKIDLSDQKVLLYYQNEEIAIYDVNDKIMKIVNLIKL